MSNTEVCILIGDQDACHCIFLKEILAARGMTAYCMSHPHLMISAMQQTFYNLVLLDSLMAEALGLKLLADIAALRSKSKIVVLIDVAHKDMVSACFRVGAFDVLEKPLTVDSLLRTIQRALDIQKIELGHEHILKEFLALQARLLRQTFPVELFHDGLLCPNDALQGFASPMKKPEHKTQKQMVGYIRSLILPLIEKWKQDQNLKNYAAQLTSLSMYLEDLISGVAPQLHDAAGLSASELRVASLIEHGITTEDIAQQLHIAPDTVRTHRKNIRKKLKIVGSKTSLKAYLQGAFGDSYGPTGLFL
jgi:DNA-binding NarL/FixJ family response regulator